VEASIMANPHQSLVVVVNGKPVTIEVNPNQELISVIPEALRSPEIPDSRRTRGSFVTRTAISSMSTGRSRRTPASSSS